ncbi:cell envelope biogenesis protein TolA [Clostridium sp. AM29-11AC]|nr:cell envelope biogenesis protein TolA [Clostridium sp. AM29-11AC]
MAMKYDKMIAVNKAESEKKVEKAIQAIEDMRSRGIQVSVTELTRCTGLSRGFFYKNILVRQKLDEATKQFLPIREGQTARNQFVRDNKLQTIREDFGKSEAENQRLKLENAQLAQRCTDLQKEVDALKKRLDRKEIALLKKI